MRSRVWIMNLRPLETTLTYCVCLHNYELDAQSCYCCCSNMSLACFKWLTQNTIAISRVRWGTHTQNLSWACAHKRNAFLVCTHTHLHAQYIFIAINLLWPDLVRGEWVLASWSHEGNDESSLFDQRLWEKRKKRGERKDRVSVSDGSKQITAAVRTLFIHSFCLNTDVFTEDEGVKWLTALCSAMVLAPPLHTHTHPLVRASMHALFISLCSPLSHLIL